MSLHIESQTTLHDFIKGLNEVCPMLRHIVFALYVSETSQTPSAITFDTLRPLLEFQKLVGFKITHKESLVITENDIKELAMAWPTLETLHLCHDPHILEDAPCDGGLSPTALMHFAEYCPNLKELGLFMNATVWTDSSQCPQIVKPFSRLQRLHVGVSRIAQPNAVARFLSDVCPRQLAIFTDSCWESAALRESAPACQPRRDMWKSVASVHRELVEVRLQERRRGQEERRLVELELQQLREDRHHVKRKASLMQMDLGDITLDS